MLDDELIRVVLGNEILSSNTNPQCKDTKNLIIEQIYFFVGLFFLARNYVANWRMKMILRIWTIDI